VAEAETGLRWRESGGVRRLEAELPGARAAFSTRLGGSGAAPFDSLNLGLLTGDERETVLANRCALALALGIDPARVVIARQVHGAELVEHAGPQRPAPYLGEAEPPEADGHRTAAAGVAALVFVADCLPIALSGPRGVAMLHGGWRGLAAGIVGDGVSAIGATHAAIGPGIGPCCFEVGPEVLAAFAPLGDGLASGSMLDLLAVARRLLERAGVRSVVASTLCTRCNPDLFFSHRGQGPRTGRQGGLVWRLGGDPGAGA
jgi:polyphenol oxidase